MNKIDRFSFDMIPDLVAAAGEPGHPMPSEVAAGVGDIMRAQWGRRARCLAACASLHSLDPADRLDIAESSGAWVSFGDLVEARRQALLARQKTEGEGVV